MSKSIIHFKQYQLSTGKDLHSIVADPLFVDPEHGDYHLRAGSPCINAGIVTNGKVDFTGLSAYKGKRHDIGAFEYVLKSKF